MFFDGLVILGVVEVDLTLSHSFAHWRATKQERERERERRGQPRRRERRRQTGRWTNVNEDDNDGGYGSQGRGKMEGEVKAQMTEPIEACGRGSLWLEGRKQEMR